MPANVGETAPDFVLDGTDRDGRRRFILSAERGHPVVLAFYPGDDTPVCTRQLCAYQSDLSVFEDLDAVVWGVSAQNLDSHEAFAQRYGLTFPLLADPDKTVAGLYGVRGPFGTKRAVFVVDADGVVRWRWVAALVGITYPSADEIAAAVGQLTR